MYNCQTIIESVPGSSDQPELRALTCAVIPWREERIIRLAMRNDEVWNSILGLASRVQVGTCLCHHHPRQRSLLCG